MITLLFSCMCAYSTGKMFIYTNTHKAKTSIVRIIKTISAVIWIAVILNLKCILLKNKQFILCCIDHSPALKGSLNTLALALISQTSSVWTNAEYILCPLLNI